MLKRTVLSFLLILSVPFCICISAIGQEQEKEGKALHKGADSIEAAGEKKDAGAEKIDRPIEKRGVGTLDRTTLEENSADDTKKDKPATRAERKKKENRKKQQLKDESAGVEEADTRESTDDLLLIDHENVKYNRIPGISIKTEDRSEDTLVKIPDDTISGKTKDKKPKGDFFGSKTDTIAKVGLLFFIIIILILYKTRSKKSKRKVVRTVPKR
jgi:hypothetical protein